MPTDDSSKDKSYYYQAEVCHRGGCRMLCLQPTGKAERDENGEWWEMWRCRNCGYKEGKPLGYRNEGW